MKQRLKLDDTINDPTNVESKTQIKQNDPLSQNDKTGSSLIKILYGNGDLTNPMLPFTPFLYTSTETEDHPGQSKNI